MTQAEPLFDRVAVVGLGLIGSSLAWRLTGRAPEGSTWYGPRLAREVVGHDADPEHLARARELGMVDRALDDIIAAVTEADLVILATPMRSIRAIGEAIAPHLAPGTIVTDTGSCKQSALADLRDALPSGIHIVPGHPVAGTEHSGPDAGFPELFEGRWCVLTPAQGEAASAVEAVARMWRAAGMQVEVMDAEHHDLVLAITSHVPHLIAYTIVGTAVDLQDDLKSEVFKFAAGGFRDFTRIAASDPVMWRDVFLTNREAVMELLGRFVEDLTALQRAIRKGDGQTLEDLFVRTRAIRRGIVDARQHEWEDEKVVVAEGEDGEGTDGDGGLDRSGENLPVDPEARGADAPKR